MDLIFCSNDLMFTSQVSRAAAERQLTYRGVGTVEQLQALATERGADARLVVLDLANTVTEPATWVQAARQVAPNARVVAYGPHVDHEQLDAARQAGCDQVFTRGQFHQQLGAILAQL